MQIDPRLVKAKITIVLRITWESGEVTFKQIPFFWNYVKISEFISELCNFFFLDRLEPYEIGIRGRERC